MKIDKKIIVSLWCIPIVGLIFACGEKDQTSFSSGGSAIKAVVEVDEDNLSQNNADAIGADGKPVLETLLIERNDKGNADILWVTDTSGSMNQELALVGQNMANFINMMDMKSDARVGVLSERSKLKIDDDLRSKIILKEQVVGSKNAYALAEQYLRGDGKFFLENSAKSLVIVTDDQSSMDFASFKTKFLDPVVDAASQLGISDLKVYGFVGLDSATCPTLASPGTVYKESADATGGEIYNLCDADWTPNFKKLADSIIGTVESSYVLKAAIEKINFVKVGDVELTAEQYSFTDKTLTIDKELLEDNTKQITVEYVVKKETES